MRFIVFVFLREIAAVSLRVRNLDSPGTNASSSPKVAVCIVGEWRSFGMPAVHTSIIQAVTSWKADAFFHYHTRYSENTISRPDTWGAIACEENRSIIDAFGFKGTRRLPEVIGCGKRAAIQFIQVDNCFRDAEDVAQREGYSYDIFVRLRPDFLVVNPVRLPQFHSNDRILLYGSHHDGHGPADLAFAVTKHGLDIFRAGNDAESFRNCTTKKRTMGIMDMFKVSGSWDIPGGLVRNQYSLQFGWGLNMSRAKWWLNQSLKQFRDNGTLSCHEVGIADHRAKKRRRRRSMPRGSISSLR
jgi:hypothetical protein